MAETVRAACIQFSARPEIETNLEKSLRADAAGRRAGCEAGSAAGVFFGG